MEEEKDEETGLPKTKVNLAEFQDDAIARIWSRLKKYNGCIVADSVGLGKTWIAKKMLEKIGYYERKNIFLIKLCKEKLENILPSKNFTFFKSLIDIEIKKALTLNPYGGIHLKNQEDIILRMPSGIRDFICSFVYNILSKYKGINKEETLSILIKEILKSNRYKLINALKTSRFNIALKKYFKSLILLLEKIMADLNNSETISPTRLANNSMLNLPFGRKVIERIINHLKNDFPEVFNTYN
ncbi:unnamed protein product [marine sediment metagenome]|uniref:Uncharacterized protein n=1 Tax=marine sediment metagenome TaxID=412755 RepID=X0VGN4_9ZZZZ